MSAAASLPLSEAPAASPRGERVPAGLVAAALGLVAAHAIALHALPALAPAREGPLARTWGLDAWRLYPAWLQAAGYAAALLAVVPATNALAARALERVGAALFAPGPRRARALRLAALALASLPVLWLFRQRYGFLGDGYLVASEVEARHVGFPHAGALALAIGVREALVALGAGAVSGVLALQATSVLAGGSAVLAALLLADALGERPAEKAGVAALLLCGGVVQLFFGYIELYAPVALALVLLVLFGLRAIARGEIPWVPTLVWLAGAALHVIAVAFLPAVAALWWFHAARRRRDAGRGPGHAPRALLLAAAALAAGGLLLAYRAVPLFRPLDRFWLPLFPSPGRPFAVVSAAHLVEFANAQALAAPAAWVLLLLGAALAIRSRAPAPRVARPPARPDPETAFLLWIAGVPLAGAFLFDFSLGARDWDLQAIAGWSVTFLAAALVAGRLRAALSSRALAYVLVAGPALSGLNALAWVGVNASDRSADWVIAALRSDPNDYYRAKPPPLALSAMLRSAGLEERALEVALEGTKEYPNDPRTLTNAGLLLMDRPGREGAARGCFLRATAVDSGWTPAHRGLFFACARLGLADEAIAAANGYAASGGAEPAVLAGAASLAIKTCRFEAAAPLVERGLAERPGDPTLAGLRRTLDAVRAIAARLPPGVRLEDARGLLEAADTLLAAGDRAAARSLLELALLAGADSAAVRERMGAGPPSSSNAGPPSPLNAPRPRTVPDR